MKNLVRSSSSLLWRAIAALILGLAIGEYLYQSSMQHRFGGERGLFNYPFVGRIDAIELVSNYGVQAILLLVVGVSIYGQVDCLNARARIDRWEFPDDHYSATQGAVLWSACCIGFIFTFLTTL